MGHLLCYEMLAGPHDSLGYQTCFLHKSKKKRYSHYMTSSAVEHLESLNYHATKICTDIILLDLDECSCWHQ
uniref:Uncharacterized protein n=1 Tax=Arundo donax TaxID=35708 RepID=A0A0A8Z1B4_ARUDO